MTPEEIAVRLEKEQYLDTFVARGEVTTIVAPTNLVETLAWLRDDDQLSFDRLSNLTCSDWPNREPRFWMAYHLWSSRHRHRLRVKAGLPAAAARIASATGIYPSAEWPEREVFDLFGVEFEGHPDLRRILLPEDWVGHPQRKDEPLGGVPTVYKGAFIPPVDERIGEA